MPIERIDPLILEDRFAVDHLLRYAVVCQLIKGKRVLDAACGTGFGSMLMAENASEVVGIDMDSATIGQCRERWSSDNLEFRVADMENLNEEDIGCFDVATTFETLEHVKAPAKAIFQLKKLLAEGGRLVGSVPGRTDVEDENPYHLHHFTESSIESLLKEQFAYVQIWRQSFSILSSLKRKPVEKSPDSLEWKSLKTLEVDLSGIDTPEDTLVFVASDRPLGDHDLAASASSRNAWMYLFDNYRAASSELRTMCGKFDQLFEEHSDLKVKFANMLGWGQWHYENLTGKCPDREAMDRVAEVVSEREQQLRKQVLDLQEEIRGLRDRLNIAERSVGVIVESRARELERSARELFNS